MRIIESKVSEILEKLYKKKYKISFAESCTGGMLTSIFVNIPGISEYLIEGIVCYSNESKIKRLGVNELTIDNHGAVSEVCIREMLAGLDTEVALAISGIAGPSGGTPEKPVGTVFIGLKIGKDHIQVKKFMFDGSRNDIRYKSCDEAIEMLLATLNNI
jgi:nicotinamide-nucleotide amidase